MTLTLDEMNRRIAARDAERDRPVVHRDVKPSKVPLPPRIVVPFCALCIEPIVRPTDSPPDWTPRQEPLGRNDALVSVCEPCATGPVVERDHLFGSRGAGVGLSVGNGRAIPRKASR